MAKAKPTKGSTDKSNNSDKEWAVEILKEDNLRLSGANHMGTYGRAKLGTGTKILMWGMRIYVVLSFILIVAQIYISLHSNN